MKKSLVLNALLTGLTIAMANISAHADEITGLVVGVHDGDTVTVLDYQKTQYKIRMVGIDAPELSQDFGKKSKWNLSDLVYNKTVKVVYSSTDMYGRTLGTVYVDGTNANLYQVQSGLAWAYRTFNKRTGQYELTDSSEFYGQYEAKAKASKLGMWIQENLVEPWVYRKQKKQGAMSDSDAGQYDVADLITNQIKVYAKKQF